MSSSARQGFITSRKQSVVFEKEFFFLSCVADPDMMKKVQVDRGAIKFVLAGANIMCPGLTSKGGDLVDDVDAETPVVSLFSFTVH